MSVAAAHDAAAAAQRIIPEMMQPKQLGVMEIFQLYGSVLPRCFLHALFSALLGGIMEYFQLDLFNYRVVWQHPYALQLFSMVLGFSLVMRIQIAYARYWEGATQCFQASSKWIDAAMQMVAFDEASKDAFSEKGFEFRLAVCLPACDHSPQLILAARLPGAALHVAHARGGMRWM